jgi:hypothetical protein
VGGGSDVEVGEKRDRVIDALNATRAAGKICIFYYLYVDSLTYAFGWSVFLCRIRFCDTLVVIFLKLISSSSFLRAHDITDII